MKISLFLFALLLCSCSSYRDTAAGAFTSVGVMTIRDLWKEEAWSNSLPKELGLPISQIKTEARAGYTKVTIQGMQKEGERARVNPLLTTLKDRNPDKPIQWSFE